MKKDTKLQELPAGKPIGARLPEFEKARVHRVVGIIEYIPKAVMSKTIIEKTTGKITVFSFDAGKELAEKASPFDIYIQIIEGAAEVFIGVTKFVLRLGEGIIIPAHASHSFHAKQPFKMISTLIKSGYED